MVFQLGLAPPTAYLAQPTANNCKTVTEGNKHSSFADFLEIFLKFAVHLDGNPTCDAAL